MKIIVVKANSFIAMHFISKCLDNQHEVIGVDKTPLPELLPYNPENKNFTYIQTADEEKPSSMPDIIVGFEDNHSAVIYDLHKSQSYPMFIRISNAYGPFQDKNAFIPSNIIKMRNKEQLHINIDDKIKKNFIYVQDVCNALYMIMLTGKIGKTYDISSKDNLTIEELIRGIAVKMEYTSSVYNPIGKRAKLTDEQFDNTQIREFGWSQEYSLEEGMDETIKWFIKKK